MHHDREQDEEIHNGNHDAHELGLLLVAVAQLGVQVPRVLDVEHSAGTNGTKVTHKEGLLVVLAHVGHELVHTEDGGDAAEEEDQEAQADQASPCQASGVGLVELVPRHNGTDVHEAAKVEQDVHARVDLVMARFGLAEELAVPVHGVASDKAGKEVIGAEHAADADKEEA